MGKIVVNQTDAKQLIILTSDEAEVRGGYYDPDGVWHELGGIQLDEIAKGEEPSGDITITITDVAKYAFIRKPITGVESETVETIDEHAFEYCEELVSVDLPNLKKGQNNMFAYTKIPVLVLPSFDPTTNEWNIFRYMGELTAIDFGTECEHVERGYFDHCSKLKTVILRSPTVADLGHTNAFASSPFASGGEGGTVYVPNDLIASYQAASNWSTILGYANNQIKAIEGSIYESAYADGTPIGG